MTITSHTKPIDEVTDIELKQYFFIMNQGFLGLTWEQFLHDLRAKQKVMYLQDTDTNLIVGFGTLTNFSVQVSGNPVRLVFSGDTYVLPEHRNSFGMGIELLAYCLQTAKQFKDQPIYYLLMSKGWRTYKIMPTLFKDYYPHVSHDTPPEIIAIADAFGTLKYPQTYCSADQVIYNSRIPQTQRLKPDSVDAQLPDDKHSQFFARTNPHYLCGDELVCLAAITDDNLTRISQRLLKQKENTS